jgi:hypothetical protein
MKMLSTIAFSRKLLAVSALVAVSWSLTGCDGGPDTDTGTTTDSTTSFDDPPAELGSTKIGAPMWEPVDYHQFSVEVGAMFENFGTVNAGLLPPPNHADHPMLGVGPGEAHAGPYDSELEQGMVAQGYEQHTAFPAAEGLLPNAILSVWMMVPSTGAPTGISPDSDAGPILPNTVFPIHVKVDAYQDDALLDGYSYEFDVPALDMMLDPPFDVEGHSHFPMFSAVVFDGLPEPSGMLETRISMVDAAGDGWDLKFQSIAVP